MQKTVLIEGLSGGRRGSEAGGMECWIDAAAENPLVSKVIVITGSDRKVRHPTESVEFVSFDELSPSFLERSLRYIPGWTARQLAFYVRYSRWLRSSAARAVALARHEKIDLAIHVSLSTLPFGTHLDQLRRFGTKTVLCGGWPLPAPEQFQKFFTLGDRFLQKRFQKFGLFLFGDRLGVDIIAAANSASVAALSGRVRGELIYVHEPTYPIRKRPKQATCLYTSVSSAPRKGAEITLRMLRRFGGSPFPLVIIGDSKVWSGFSNVTVLPPQEEPEFEKLLASAEFVLSTSFRDNGPTPITKAAGVGSIPVVTPIPGFADIPPNAKVSISPGSPEDSLHAALESLGQMNEQEKASLSEAAELWGKSITDPNRLKNLITRWLSESGGEQ